MVGAERPSIADNGASGTLLALAGTGKGGMRASAVGCCLAAVVACLRAFAQSAPPPQSDALGPATMALVETWPDGRTNFELTSPRRAVMWTPRFPRIAGYIPPEATRPVFAVQFARVLTGRDIRVDVSVLLGSAEPPGVPVATVVISPGSHVVVGELAKFGVQPVTLSMIEVAPLTPYLPTVVSVSPQIEIASVDILNAPYPGYRLRLRNLGLKGVSNVHVQSYRGDEKAISTLKRSDDGRPMMEPGGSYTFDLNLTSGAGAAGTAPGTWTPRPIDLIEFDSVRWDDGTYDGTPPFVRVDAMIESDSGRRVQLRRIIDALQAALADTSATGDVLAAARLRIGMLPDAELDQLPEAKKAMEATKATIQADIVRFASKGPVSNDAAAKWLTTMRTRYQAWLTRLSPP